METAAQMVIGQLVAVGIWMWMAGLVAPDFGSWRDAVAVNFPFLVASVVRGYIVRCAFALRGW